MKIGVALSVYNKINHLKTNINIIRKHWNSLDNEVVISVCCNDVNNFDNVKSLDIDNFSTGNYELKSQPKPFRRLRIFDCIRNSIINCEADYVIHYHADAYALNFNSINSIINKMKDNDVKVAYRGKGTKYRNDKNICGDVDDHFLIFKKTAVVESNIFDVDYQKALNFLCIGNPETLLSKLITENFNDDQILHYSDMYENQVGADRPDSFYKDNIMHRAMTPYNFDNDRQFLHFGNEVTQDFIINNLIERGVKNSLILV
jgi:hypothetical protein